MRGEREGLRKAEKCGDQKRERGGDGIGHNGCESKLSFFNAGGGGGGGAFLLGFFPERR